MQQVGIKMKEVGVTAASCYSRIVWLVVVGITLVSDLRSQTVNFPDPQLEFAIRAALNHPDGELTVEDLASLSDLVVMSSGLTNLLGLEAATNLTQLILADNSLRDVGPIAGLSKLQILDLSQNPITNHWALGSLVSLKYLTLQETSLLDVGWISGLANLFELDLFRNEITNVSALATLSDLESLRLGQNPLTNYDGISGLSALVSLSLSDNDIHEIAFISAFTNLTTLDLSGNLLTNIQPLEIIRNLHAAYLHGNILKNIQPLVALTNLAYVVLQGNLLDLTPGSAAMTVIQTLQAQFVTVTYQPQNQPPTIRARGHWSIPANKPSTLPLFIDDDRTSYGEFAITAVSSNTALIASTNIALFPTNSWPSFWRMTVTPTTGQTGLTAITLIATDNTGQSTNTTIEVHVVAAEPMDSSAISNSNLVWTTGVDAPWINQSLVSHDNVSAAQSSGIGSWLETWVTGPGILKFWWKASFASNDFPLGGQFTADCFESGLRSGLFAGAEWQQISLKLPAGIWFLRWDPVSDLPSPFLDAQELWLDEVSFVPGPIVSSLRLELAPTRTLLYLDGELSESYWVEVSDDLLNWTQLAKVKLFAFVTQYRDYSPSSHVRFYRLRKALP